MRGCTCALRGCSRTLKTPNSPPLVVTQLDGDGDSGNDGGGGGGGESSGGLYDPSFDSAVPPPPPACALFTLPLPPPLVVNWPSLSGPGWPWGGVWWLMEVGGGGEGCDGAQQAPHVITAMPAGDWCVCAFRTCRSNPSPGLRCRPGAIAIFPPVAITLSVTSREKGFFLSILRSGRGLSLCTSAVAGFVRVRVRSSLRTATGFVVRFCHAIFCLCIPHSLTGTGHHAAQFFHHL